MEGHTEQPSAMEVVIQAASAFGGFRMEGYPTMYAALKTAAHVDVLEAGIILAFVMVAASCLLLLPATRGLTKVYFGLRVFVSLVIGAILATANFGQRWEVGSVVSNSAYKPGFADEVKVHVGLHIGLRGANITLKNTEKIPESYRHEIIDYNEQFSWSQPWDQGRFGFGPYAGQLQREFREGQRVGLPLPILWIVDYLTIDGEGFRFGRFYRTAGWYSHIAMWAALPSWLLSVVLLHSAVQYGAILTAFTGLLQLLACFIWSVVRNPDPLFIPFEDGNIKMKFGIDFWLTFVNGLVCVILGIAIYASDLRFPDSTSLFFGIDPNSIYDEIYKSKEEIEAETQAQREGGDGNQIEMSKLHPPQPNGAASGATEETTLVLKRRTTVRAAQRSRIRAPVAPPRRMPTVPLNEEEEEPMYLNVVNREEQQQASGFSNRGYEQLP